MSLQFTNVTIIVLQEEIWALIFKSVTKPLVRVSISKGREQETKPLGERHSQIGQTHLGV